LNRRGIMAEPAAEIRSPVEGLLAHLVERGRLDAAGAARATRLREETSGSIPAILTKLGLITERDLAAEMAAYLDITLAAADDYPLEPVLDQPITAGFLKGNRVVPLTDTADELAVAMADPFDDYVRDALVLAAGKPVVASVGVPADIEAALERLHGDGSQRADTVLDLSESGSNEDAQDDLERLKDLAAEAPVIRFVNQLIGRAIETRASDIHIEPFDRKVVVRFRVDGVLREVEAPPHRLRAAVTSRIKLMAKLNIAERRLPQDGRIRLTVRGKEIDLRISTVPTMHGESVVLRILDKGEIELDLDSLGYQGKTLERYLEILDRPTGILLVTGPTGSGKTTTLYASLARINTADRKILTVEDPVEYELEGINQVQVKPKIGLTFASALRSLVRQDPDIILIGEIRDLETAEIAGQAALTGHKVLSTLHTNDAASSITRLMDMGVEDYLVTSTVNGIVAQRLVRSLCMSCREAKPIWPELAAQLRDHVDVDLMALKIHQPVGCERCDGTGYRGRTSIHEILVMTEAIRRLVLRHAEATEIQKAAIAEGMRTMFQDGLDKVVAGVTTIDEVLRVTREQ